jgi:hypothetical protein
MLPLSGPQGIKNPLGMAEVRRLESFKIQPSGSILFKVAYFCHWLHSNQSTEYLQTFFASGSLAREILLLTFTISFIKSSASILSEPLGVFLLYAWGLLI